MKKWLTYLVAAAMLVCFAAPAMTEEASELYVANPYDLPQDYSAYPLEGEREISVWFAIESWFSQAVKSFDDIMVTPEIEKITGVNVNWIHPAAGMEAEQFNLMMAGDALPDVIVTAARYPGGLPAGVAEGVYMDLTDLIPQYAPNYQAFRMSDPDRMRTTMTDDGKLLGIYSLSPYAEWVWWGPMIKTEPYIAAGYDPADPPKTIDDWYEMLTKFKEMGMAYPLVPNMGSGIDWNGVWVQAWTGGGEWLYIDENGQYQFGPTQPGMRDYLKTFAQWYAEGLIEPDFATRPSDVMFKNMVSADCGAFTDSPDTMYGYMSEAGIDFFPAPYPMLDEDDVPRFRWKSFKNCGQEAAITVDCQDVEAALRFLDFGFTAKGWELYGYGMPQIAHDFDENGYPYIHDESIIFNDPNELPLSFGFWQYKFHWGPFIRDEHNTNPLIVQSGEEGSGAMRQYWTQLNSGDGWWDVPKTFTAEEAQREAQIATQIATLRTEVATKIIMGLEPIERWDTFVDECHTAGLEEMIGIWQTAYERYMARGQ